MDELQEKGFQLEQLRAEKQTLEDENRRILNKALSHDEASEMTRAKQEVALKEQELKRLRQKMTTVRPQRKPRPCVPIPTAVAPSAALCC